jgi:lauroyl/myristoyl acyltransferase
MLPLYLAIMGPRASYAVAASMARAIFRLLPMIGDRMERNVRAAPALTIPENRVAAFCERAFVHQIWNLTDLFLAERLLHRGTFTRFGGRMPADLRNRLLDAQRRGSPMILLTAYFGPFDLLPLLLGLNGVHVAALYKPHANPWFDAQRRTLRGRGGCELVLVSDAIARLPAVLEGGGTIAVLADHHDTRRGIPVEFLGRATVMSKSVALLAQRYDADVVVAGLRRTGPRFSFQFVLSEVIQHQSWAGMTHDAGIEFITAGYVAAVERMVLASPEQYLWARPRWGASGIAEDSAIAL